MTRQILPLLLLTAAGCRSDATTDPPDATDTDPTASPTDTGTPTPTDTGTTPGTTTSALGPGAWMWANPRPQGTDLTRVRFASDTRVYAIGGGGVVVRSDDAGLSWDVAYGAYAVQEIAYGSLYGLSFIDADHGWVVGTAGRVSATADGAVTWADRSVETPRDLRAVHFHDVDHGVVVGDRGSVFVTGDGGASWTPAPHPAGTDLDFSAVVFGTASVGWIGGEEGTVLVTDDGGATWEIVATNWADDVTVGGPVGPDQVVFGTAQGRVIRSVAPGSWTFPLLVDNVDDLHFDDAANGRVLYYDKGASHLGTLTDDVWNHEDLDPTAVSLSFDVRGTRGAMVGRWGRIHASDDAAATWQARGQDLDGGEGTTGQLVDLAFGDADHGIAVGFDGAIVRTEDGGVTWSVADSGVTPHLLGAWMLPSGVAFAVGQENTAIRSLDGGATWAPMTLPVDGYYLYDLCMWDASRGLLVGASSPSGEVLLVTDDGGDTWVPRDRGNEATPGFLSVWCQGTDKAWLGSGFGLITSTDDGGDTFTTLDTGSTRALWSMQFVDDDHGWAATGSQEMLRTVDGGLKWERITGLPRSFDDVQFGTTTDGVAVSPGGNVWGSPDGGDTWVQQHAGQSSFSHVRAVWMTSPTDGVIVGTEHKIQYTRTGGWTP